VGKDFGLLYEIPVARDTPSADGGTGQRVTGDGVAVPYPGTWSPGAEHAGYHEAVAQAVLAEQVGFTHVWAVEHHFLEEFSHCSAPEVFLAYLAARTTTLRLGHGVRLLPFPYNHPLKVAEQASVLDLLCDGRLEVGTGRSATRLEMEGFRVDPANTRSMWLEALDVIVGAWTEDVFEWKGEWFDVPPRAVLPKPFQRPHPPLWVAGTSADSHELAGELGLGMLSFTILVELSELARRVKLYRDGLQRAKPKGKFVNAQCAVYTIVHCAETNEEARANLEEPLMTFTRMNAGDIMAGFVRWLDPKEPTYDYFKALTGLAVEDITFDLMSDNDMVIVGDPDECARKVRRYFSEADIDQLICQMKIVGVPHEKVMRSIELFGKHVIPEFA
jgi:luciferase family oxidoreductase group 1